MVKTNIPYEQAPKGDNYIRLNNYQNLEQEKHKITRSINTASLTHLKVLQSIFCLHGSSKTKSLLCLCIMEVS